MVENDIYRNKYQVQVQKPEFVAFRLNDRLASTLGMGAKILIIEDSEDFAWLVDKFCDHLGHSAVIAGDGQSAMEFINREDFDLIISDLTLPDISGFDLIKLIRQKTDVPALTISGRTSPEDVQRAIEAGFNAHCSKPIDSPCVVSKIQELLGLPPV